MYPVINLFGLQLYPYGLMIGIGIVSAVLLFLRRCKNRGYNEEWAFNLAMLCIVGGIIGAKLFFIIVELPSFIKDPSLFIRDFNQGFVIYGGVILGAVVGYFYSKNRKWSFNKMFDLAAPLIAMAQGFGRIGCLFAGCCYGKETDSVIGIHFDNSPYAPHGVSLIPTQAISSIGDFLIFGVLMWFDNRRKTKDGQTGALYMIMYSVGRFIIEIFRDDPRGTVFNVLSTSQFICIFVLLAGIVMLYLISQKHKRLSMESEPSDAAEELSDIEYTQDSAVVSGMISDNEEPSAGNDDAHEIETEKE